MRVGDDVALGGLTKNLGQPHDRHHAAFDQVCQYHAGTDGRQLIHVAHENDMRVGGNGFEQLVHQLHVHHRSLIHHEKVALKGAFLIPGESAR